MSRSRVCVCAGAMHMAMQCMVAYSQWHMHDCACHRAPDASARVSVICIPGQKPDVHAMCIHAHSLLPLPSMFTTKEAMGVARMYVSASLYMLADLSMQAGMPMVGRRVVGRRAGRRAGRQAGRQGNQAGRQAGGHAGKQTQSSRRFEETCFGPAWCGVLRLIWCRQ